MSKLPHVNINIDVDINTNTDNDIDNDPDPDTETNINSGTDYADTDTFFLEMPCSLNNCVILINWLW